MGLQSCQRTYCKGVYIALLLKVAQQEVLERPWVTPGLL